MNHPIIIYNQFAPFLTQTFHFTLRYLHAAHIQAVDEISFLSVSASQWLLGELHVAASAWTPVELHSDSDSVRPPTDAAARVVQVLPGPHASIEEASESEAWKQGTDWNIIYHYPPYIYI